MIRNYLKATFRNIARNKLFSAINIFGLAIGMACFILIFLWINDEIHYDKFHRNKEDLYRVVLSDKSSGRESLLARTPPALGPILKKDYPEISRFSRVFLIDGTLSRDNKNYLEDIALVDEDFFKMFSFPVISGSNDQVVSDWHDIVLSEATALKMFGKTDVVGEFITIDNEIEAKITAVIDNKKEFSHLKFDALMSIELLFEFGLPKDMITNFNNPLYTYVQLQDDAVMENLNLKIADIINQADNRLSVRVYLQKLEDLYLESNFIGDYEGLGNIQFIYIFSVIAFFVLLIACINFMNISTAKSSVRSKEIGMRKVAGAKRKQLIFQLIGESILLSFLAHAIAIIFIELLLPLFNNLTSKSLEIDYLNPYFYLFLLGIILFSGLLSGSYPAFYLSSFNPISVLKKDQDTGKKGKAFRRILVVFQFAISGILIISVLLIYLQINYLTGKDLGYNKDNLVYFSLSNIGDDFDSFKKRLSENNKIEGITCSSHILSNVTHYHHMDWEGKSEDSKVRINILFVDADFVNTLQMKVETGRDFSINFASDSSESYIINSEAAKQIGFENPIGKFMSADGQKGKIIGVIKDFHFKSLHSIIEPMCLSIAPRERFYCYIRVKPENMNDVMPFVDDVWSEFNQNIPFEYFHMDVTLQNMYKSESSFGKLSILSTIIALIVACLGLFGLASYIAERRIKEIGIRRALGASTISIVNILTKQMLSWVLLAGLISCPISYFIINKWIQNFAYQITIQWWVFLVGILISLTIALLTIISKAVKVANTNPVNALRYE